MSRKSRAKPRIIPSDARYGDEKVTKLINSIMKNGKKACAEKAVYKAFDMLKEKYKKNPPEIFKNCIDKVTPEIEVRSRKIGGTMYHIPTPVSSVRGIKLALKWITISIRNSKSRNLVEKIFNVIVESIEGKSWAVKKKEEVFKTAEANKAFAHYA